MATRLGNTSASSLVSSAKSASNSQQAYNDSLQAYDFAFGPQDQAAFVKYQAYLNARIGTLGNSDPAKVLTLTRTLTDANRTYVKNQIQNANLQVQEGNFSPTQKEQMLRSLTQQAYQTGDVQFGQQLEGQYNSTVIANQNAAQAAARSGAADARAAQADNATAVRGQVTGLQAQLKAANDYFAKTGDFYVKDPKTGQNITNKDTGQPLSIYAFRAGIVSQLHDMGTKVLGNNGLSSAEQHSISNEIANLTDNQQYYKDIANANTLKNGQVPQVAIPHSNADGSLTYTTGESYKTGMVAGKDKAGNYQFAPLNDPNQSTQDVNPNAVKQALASLKADGIRATQQSDGTISAVNPKNGVAYNFTVDASNGRLIGLHTDAAGHTYEVSYTLNTNGLDKNGNIVKNADGSLKRNPNKDPFQNVSYQELQAEDKANQGNSTRDAFAKDAQPLQDKMHSLLGGPYSSDPQTNDMITQSRLMALTNRAKFNADAAATLQKVQELQAQINQAKLGTINLAATRANSAAQTGGVGGAPKRVINPSPAQAAVVAKAGAAASGQNPAAAAIGGAVGGVAGNLYARSYLTPFQASLPQNHYGIIAGGTNYGGTVASLRQAGVNDQQLAAGGIYDQALRAANTAGQFH